MNSKKAIFITGGAAGIGRETARLFARQGWFVGVYDVDVAGAKALCEELGGEAHCVHGSLDVTDAEAFTAAVASFEAAAGRMDLLFNNAGILRMGRFEEVPLAEQHLTVNINVNGVINGVSASLDLLTRTASSHGRARIVSMCSISAIYGIPELAVYSASKFAVRSLTESLSLEFAERRIAVCDIMPSYVDTGMVRDQRKKARSVARMGVQLTPQDIARLVWDSMSTERLHHLGSKRGSILYALAGALPALARQQIRATTGF